MTRFQGLRTVVYIVGDVSEAKAWYSRVLEKEPYFDEPFYVGFSVGGFELGLLPEDDKNNPGPGGAIAYWGVEEIGKALDRVVALGAKLREDVEDVGKGIKVATVTDPYGNIFGLIENPQFKIEDD